MATDQAADGETDVLRDLGFNTVAGAPSAVRDLSFTWVQVCNALLQLVAYGWPQANPTRAKVQELILRYSVMRFPDVVCSLKMCDEGSDEPRAICKLFSATYCTDGVLHVRNPRMQTWR
jgi:hypothetical protein